MPLRLFEHPLSPYASKVKIVLYEKGIPFERVFVDLGEAGEDRDYQEFVMSSPRREVPCLVDGRVRVFDSTIMLEYIEERWPKPPTMPEDPVDRARIRMLEEMMDGEYDAVNWGLAEVLFFQRAKGELGENLKTRARLQLQRLWNRLERELDGRAWLNGAAFGRGDAVAIPQLLASARVGCEPDDRHPRLRAWIERASSRETVKRVELEAAEGLRRELAAAESRGGAPTVRLYRDTRLEWMIKTGGFEVVREGLENGTIRFSEEFE